MDTNFLGKQVLDLTFELEAGKQSWNVHPPITLIPYHQSSLNRWRNGKLCPGFDTKLMMMTDHTGTHVDAPRHFHPNGKGMSDIALHKLMGEALLLDVSKPQNNNPITVDDIINKLKTINEEIKPNDILLLKCWPAPWGEGDGFDNADALEGEVADFLLEKQIKILGTDIPTVDFLDNPNKDLHVKLLENEILIIENLVNLEKISVNRFHFLAAPLNFKHATGSPIRAMAFL